MRKASFLLIGLSAIVGLECAESLAEDSGPKELKAFWREGQTFLTWREDDAAKGEWYKVYASTEPINAGNITKAEFIAKIPEGSRAYRFYKTVGKSKLKGVLERYKWIKGLQLEDDDNAGKILPEGTGVFVRTIKKEANTFYAVTIEKDGKEETGVSPVVNSLTEAVKEAVETPGAIRLQKYADHHYAYLFFTDFEIWNPDKIDDNWNGYAHVLHVRAPKGNDGKSRYPLSVRLHAYSAWKDWHAAYCWPNKNSVDMRLLDYRLTWWYGFSDAMPKVEGGKYSKTPVKGTVVNFTEQRVIQAIRWLMKDPKNFEARIDPMQVSTVGGSMGGSGVNVFGIRHGEIFAGGWGMKGITNWALPKKHNNWANNMVAKVGPHSRNDPTNEGIGVYDVLNLPKWLGDHPEIETPFLDISHGIIDGVITFYSVPDYWRGLEKGKHPYSAGWLWAGHASSSSSGGPMTYYKLRRDESLPALANASCNTPMKTGFRMMGQAASFAEKNMKIAKGTFPKDVVGKMLALGPDKSWKIESATDTEVTIADGNLQEYLPPLSRWDMHVLKTGIKKKEGKDRAPNAEEKKALQEKKKKSFLIIDGPVKGTWNGHFAWSSRNQNFDAKSAEDDIIDEEKKWAICLRLQKNKLVGEWREETATVDVTPRRLQKFKPKPGETVHWVNLDMSTTAKPKEIAKGDVTADKHGLVTVPGFVVGKKGWGNRLVLTRD